MVLAIIGLVVIVIYLAFCIDSLHLRLKAAEEQIIEMKRRI